MAGVTVRGSAQREVEPDRVRLTLSLEARAEQADAALRDLAARSAALDGALDALGDGIVLRRPSSVSVGPWHSPRGQEQGQVARRSLTVEARAGGPLGDLLARAVSAGATVGGTQWVVEPGNPAHGELRAAAVADARRRAEVYAEAAGLRLGPLEWLAEPGLGPGRQERGETGTYAMGRMAFAAEAGGEASRVLELRPEPVVVSAAVEAGYGLLPGPVGSDAGTYL